MQRKAYKVIRFSERGSFGFGRKLDIDYITGQLNAQAEEGWEVLFQVTDTIFSFFGNRQALVVTLEKDLEKEGK